MGVSIYFSIEQVLSFSEREKNELRSVVEKYNSDYRYRRIAEDLSLWEDLSEADNMFRGSVKLPSKNPLKAYKAGRYWVKCLNELRRAFPLASWTVSLEDAQLVWDEDKGWLFDDK